MRTPRRTLSAVEWGLTNAGPIEDARLADL